jgi:phage FluMu protein Com
VCYNKKVEFTREKDMLIIEEEQIQNYIGFVTQSLETLELELKYYIRIWQGSQGLGSVDIIVAGTNTIILKIQFEWLEIRCPDVLNEKIKKEQELILETLKSNKSLKKYKVCDYY